MEQIGRRPTSGFVKTAAILLMVFGGLLGLLGLVLVAAAGQAHTFSATFFNAESADAIGGIVAGTGVVVGVLGFGQILGGIGSWRGSGWGRAIGLVYGLIGTLLGLASVGGSASASASVRSGGIGSGLVIVAIYGFITVALVFGWKARAY